MKIKKLTRYLIKILVIFLIILVADVTAYFYFSDENETLDEEINKLKAEKNNTEGSLKTLQLKLNDAGKAMKNYNNFSASRDGNVQNFRRDFARTMLASLRDQDAILDLEFSMEPFTKIGGGTEKPSVALFKSKITIQFTADTDIDVFGLIRDICQSFPGNVEVISYSVERKHDVNNDVLLAIAEGRGRDPLVKGEIIFEWQSIQDNPDYKKSAEPTINPVKPN